MKITVLAENTTIDENLGCEHGLSLYIESNGHNILFDMGQSDLFHENAKKSGVDLSSVDIAVLSHGHYDHGGGLSEFFKINDKAKVYVSKYAFEAYYNKEKYIGLDVSLKDNKRLVFVDEMLRIDKGLTLYSCNDEHKKFDLGSFGLSKMVDNKLTPDDYLHEQYLLIEECDSKVLISGCSHKGILNIVNWFDVGTIIGGFHFSALPMDDTLVSYAQYLNSFDTRFYTCHCTGIQQYEFMKQYMDKLEYLSTGTTLEI